MIGAIMLRTVGTVYRVPPLRFRYRYQCLFHRLNAAAYVILENAVVAVMRAVTLQNQLM